MYGVGKSHQLSSTIVAFCGCSTSLCMKRNCWFLLDVIISKGQKRRTCISKDKNLSSMEKLASFLFL